MRTARSRYVFEFWRSDKTELNSDYKCSNMISYHFLLQICDFGLARIVHTDAIHTSKHGSSAPAEIRPKKKARHSTEFPPQPVSHLYFLAWSLQSTSVYYRTLNLHIQ